MSNEGDAPVYLSMPPTQSSPDQSFDLAPDAFRALGHELIELMIGAVAAERADPVLRPMTGKEMRTLLDEPLPQQGTAPEEILAIWREHIAPYCRRNGHPRFFAYVCTSADPLGILADAMASALNQPVTAWRSSPAAAEIERLVIRWLDQLVGFNGGGHGLLVSGGSAANLHGLTCAVVSAERRAGLPSGSRNRLTLYLSNEGHVSLRKAARLLGLADDHLRFVAVDRHRRLDVNDLERQLAADSAAGLIPAAVCASAGTANTGAIDPLGEIADLCRDGSVWLHIDGAYGAPAVLTADYRWMADSFARADSLSLDPHKWLFATPDAGSILIRDEETSRRAFSWFSEYTAVSHTDPIERYAFFDHGVEMSRRFRGLKVWTILKARGVEGLRAAIERDITLRRHLDRRVAESPRLEALGSELSISCFRYLPDGERSEDQLNRLNQRILETIVREGRCYLSPTTLDDKYALRVCIVNFRTQVEDVDLLVDEVLRIGGGG